jgi:hypothetical protein
MLTEYKRYLIKALCEIDFVIDDMEFDNIKNETYYKLTDIKRKILDIEDDLSKDYFLECEKWNQ